MKKGMKLIPFFLFSLLLTAAAVLAAAVLFCTVMDRNALFEKASVAVVMGSDAPDDLSDDAPSYDSTPSNADLKTQMMITLVSQMSSVKSICNFSYMSPADAAAALREGTVDVVIYLPSGIYDSINNGENHPVTLLLSDNAAALQQDVFSQLVSAGVSLIRSVENAIYAVDNLSDDLPLAGELTDIEDSIFSVYVTTALNRTSAFSTESTSAFGDLSMREFYLLSAALLVLLIFGLGFGTFYSPSENEAHRYLSRFGLHPVLLDIAKLLSMTAVMFIMAFLMMAGLRVGNSALALTDSAALTITAGSVGHACLAVIPFAAALAFSVSSLVHLIFTWISGSRGSLFYLLIVTALFTVSGGFLPSAWMPAFLRSAVTFSPITVWQNAFAGGLYRIRIGAPLGCTLLTGLILLIPAFIRRTCHES